MRLMRPCWSRSQRRSWRPFGWFRAPPTHVTDDDGDESLDTAAAMETKEGDDDDLGDDLDVDWSKKRRPRRKKKKKTKSAKQIKAMFKKRKARKKALEKQMRRLRALEDDGVFLECFQCFEEATKRKCCGGQLCDFCYDMSGACPACGVAVKDGKPLAEVDVEEPIDLSELDAEASKVLFVIDSLGMLLTPTDVDQFNKGDMKGDMGRKPKALTSLVRNTVNMIGSHNVGLVCTNHTYASQDMFDPDDKISGGQGFIYASSIVVAMKKLKLKEDEDGNKISQVMGIRAGCKVMKTRYAKPFEAVQVKIPYETGMNPYSGLVELFEAKGLIQKQGNRLKYTTSTGEEVLEYRKNWTGTALDTVMSDFAQKEANVVNTAEVTEEPDQTQLEETTIND